LYIVLPAFSGLGPGTISHVVKPFDRLLMLVVNCFPIGRAAIVQLVIVKDVVYLLIYRLYTRAACPLQCIIL